MKHLTKTLALLLVALLLLPGCVSQYANKVDKEPPHRLHAEGSGRGRAGGGAEPPAP